MILAHPYVKYQIFIIYFIMILLMGSCATESPIPSSCRQLLLVITSEWESNTGTLQYFEREHAKSFWGRQSGAIPVVVGRNGLGWGMGLHQSCLKRPVKKEGDGRSPAGVFYLGPVVGYSKPVDMTDLKMFYLQAGQSIQCVDDVQSRYYNQIVDSTRVQKPDWASHEKMKRDDGLYRLVIVINHNTKSPIAGKGSCIFFHIWRNAQSATAGCTAMDAEYLETIIHWLDQGKNPVLVQLPRSIYFKNKKTWRLP